MDATKALWALPAKWAFGGDNAGGMNARVLELDGDEHADEMV